MPIESLGNFTSKVYQDFKWKDIFCSAGSAVSSNHNPVGLVNIKNFIIVPDDFSQYDCFQIYFPFKNSEIIGSDIEHCAFSCALFSGYQFLKINKKYSLSIIEDYADSYIQFLRELAFQINLACKTIFKYTHDHLSNRLYGDEIISKIPVIQSDFSCIYLLLEKLTMAVKNIFSTNDAVNTIGIAIDALSFLSKLSGARSILQYGSIELIYHLKIFQKFLGDDTDGFTGI